MLKYFYFFAALTSSIVNGNVMDFKGKIVGNRTISECVNGYKLSSRNNATKMYRTTSEFTRREGYPAEEHVVQTDDGYILTLHRIPGKAGAPPVFLQHGLLGSSFDWVITGRGKSLAFKLADAGYDVWMGNFRGNTYCRCHGNHHTSKSKFWDFSWHEIGIYDLSSMINYVTNKTAQKVIYIGHSMGTTSFFVMAIERPDIAEKVKVMMALAPVAFIDHATTIYRMLTPFTSVMEFLARTVGEFLPQNRMWKTAIKYLCSLTSIQRKVCAALIFSLTVGFDARQFNYTLAPDILYHLPAGSSFKIVSHYSYGYKSKRFQYYDYGTKKNLKLYNSSQPPDYDISKITVPTGIFWSDSDKWSNPVDVMRFYEQIPNKILNHHVDDRNFHHLDYLFAMDAPNLDVSRFYEQLPMVILNHRVEYPNFQHVDFLFGIEAPKYAYETLMIAIESYS